MYSDLYDVNTLVLTDEEICTDLRVLKAFDGYTQPKLIVNCRDFAGPNHSMLFKTLYYSWHALMSFAEGFRAWKILKSGYNTEPKAKWFGFRSAIRLALKARYISQQLKKRYKSVAHVHANDLFCGIIGRNLAIYYNARLTYDIHELEFHRNRKRNSWLRTACDVAFEKKVIRRADRLIIVNQPIADLYSRIYRVPRESFSVINNNHFELRPALRSASDRSSEVAICYVGGGVRHRMLEQLAEECNKESIKVHSFFIGDVPSFAEDSGWDIGDRDYYQSFVKLVDSRRLIMWCCAENVCLSYQLSLPNKFFQAIAVGIPVIAAKDSYLEYLVNKYGIGLVYNGKNFDSIIRSFQDDQQYENICNRVRHFQSEHFEGTVF